MKKLILIVGALIVIAAVVVFFGLSNLGPIIKTAVNTYGPKITLTQVSLGDAGVSLFSGEAKLKDFLLGNPKGFSSAQAMKIGSIYVNLDEKSLTSDTIVIDKIQVLAPEITYETSGKSDNFKALLSNVQKTTGGGKKAASKEAKSDSGGGGKKLLIRSVVIKDGQINLSAKALAGQKITTELPLIEMKDVGGKKEGVTPAQAFNEILAALYKQIQSPDVTAALNDGLKNLGVSLTGANIKLGDEKTQKQVEGIKDAVKGVKGLLGD